MAIIFLILILMVVVVFSGSADAYIGPSLGVGTIGILVGFIISILLSLFAIVWYPVKRLWRFLMKTGRKVTPTDKKPHS